MIEFAKITGKMSGNRIQVKMPTGECVYLQSLVVGNNVSMPSQVWITGNKDKFLAVVGYEGTSYHEPFILGFYPVQGANPATYDLNERLLEVLIKLVEQLYKAKVNTQIGPQTFMPNTLVELDTMYSTLQAIKEEINSNVVNYGS